MADNGRITTKFAGEPDKLADMVTGVANDISKTKDTLAMRVWM